METENNTMETLTVTEENLVNDQCTCGEYFDNGTVVTVWDGRFYCGTKCVDNKSEATYLDAAADRFSS